MADQKASKKAELRSLLISSEFFVGGRLYFTRRSYLNFLMASESAFVIKPF